MFKKQRLRREGKNEKTPEKFKTKDIYRSVSTELMGKMNTHIPQESHQHLNSISSDEGFSDYSLNTSKTSASVDEQISQYNSSTNPNNGQFYSQSNYAIQSNSSNQLNSHHGNSQYNLMIQADPSIYSFRESQNQFSNQPISYDYSSQATSNQQTICYEPFNANMIESNPAILNDSLMSSSSPSSSLVTFSKPFNYNMKSQYSNSYSNYHQQNQHSQFNPSLTNTSVSLTNSYYN
jgi:hypothetical protein